MRQNWLITGVSSGLGRALAREAASAGHAVAGTVRNSADAAAFEADVPGASAIVADLTSTGAASAVLGSASDLLGHVDVLVNNAGRGFTAAIEEASLDEIRDLFELNLIAPIAMIQAVLPGMRSRGSGHIMNITSISGFKPWSGTGFYCASKFALEGVGQTLAQEIAGFGIKVTNVQPGGLRTEFNGRSLHGSEHTIDAYENSAHIARRALPSADGKQPGDPVKAARAILMAAAAEHPPLNLLLGADAVSMANQRIAALLLDMGRWGPISETIGFDAPAPVG